MHPSCRPRAQGPALAALAAALGFALGCHPTTARHGQGTVVDGVHDPGRLVRYQGQVFLAASPVETWAYAPDTRRWTPLSDDLYGEAPPSWDPVDHDGEPLRKYWAPSTLPAPWDPDRLLMMHSAVSSDENDGIARIGFALSSGRLPDLTWEASPSFVVESTNAGGLDPESRQADPFAIDPSVFLDPQTGRLWLVYGSHGSGIHLVELDAATGFVRGESAGIRLRADDPRAVHLASRAEGTFNAIEAAYLHHLDGHYYLFVNWDACCGGVDSTYNLRIGRAEAVTGPYLDRDGVDLAEGGGSLLLDARGEMLGSDRFRGPGHASVYEAASGAWYLAHHFYDADPRKTSEGSLAIWGLRLGADGWPEVAIDVPFEP